MLRAVNFYDSYSEAHSVADVGGEFVLAHSTNMNYFERTWRVPTKDLVEIYKRLGHAVTSAQLTGCMLQGFAATQGIIAAGRYLFPKWAQKSPLLVDKYYTYFRGGINDMSTWVSTCWRDTLEWVEHGPATPMCKSMDHSKSKRPGPIHENPGEPGPNDPDDDDDDDGGGEYISTHGARAKKLIAMGVGYGEYLKRMGWKPESSIDSNGHSSIFLSKIGLLPSLFSFQSPSNSQSQLKSKKTTNTRKSPFGRYFKHLTSLISEFFVDSYQTFIIQFTTWSPHRCSPIRTQAKFKTTTMYTNISYANLGASFAHGDFNGDGLQDVAVGAPGYTHSSTHTPQAGAVFIIYGSSRPLPNTFLEIEEAANLIILGDQSEPGSRFGTSLTVVDLNKDGIDDLVVSAPMHNAIDLFYDGQVYIFHGSLTYITKKTLFASESADVIIASPQARPYHTPHEPYNFAHTLLGTTLTSFDIDSDGFSDLLIGSPYAETYKGFPQRGSINCFQSSTFKSTSGGEQVRLNASEASSWTLDPVDFVKYQWFGSSISFLPSTGTLVVSAPGWRGWEDLESLGRLYVYRVPPDGTKPDLVGVVEGETAMGGFGENLKFVNINNTSLLAIASPTEKSKTPRAKFLDLPGLLTTSKARGYSSGIIRFVDLSKPATEFIFRISDLSVSYTLSGSRSNARLGKATVYPLDGVGGVWVSEPLVDGERGRVYTADPTNPRYSRICFSGESLERLGSSFLTVDLDGNGKKELLVASEGETVVGGRKSGQRQEALRDQYTPSDTEIAHRQFIINFPENLVNLLSVPSFGVAGMVDISGYSSVTSALQTLGKMSSEVITNTVGRYMEKVVNLIMACGGDVIKFLGDAILVSFPQQENESKAEMARRATSCILDVCINLAELDIDLENAIKSHTTLHQDPYRSRKATVLQRRILPTPLSPTATIVNDDHVPLNDAATLNRKPSSSKIVLAIHVALTAGTIEHIFLGADGLRMDYIISGKCMGDLGILLDATKRGELGISASLMALFEGSITPEMDSLAIRDQDQPYWIFTRSEKFEPLKRLVSSPAVLPSLRKLTDAASSLDLKATRLMPIAKKNTNSEKLMETEIYNFLRLFVNESLRFKLEVGTGSSLNLSTYPALPTNAVAASLPQQLSSDTESPEPSSSLSEFRQVTIVFVKIPPPFDAKKGQKLFSIFVKCVSKWQGVVQQFAQDDKGTTILGCFGLPPWTHEKDALHALHAATEYEQKTLKFFAKSGKGLSIGVASGDLLFSVLGGSTQRWDASLLGDCVNLAARLLGITSGNGAVKCDSATYKATKVDFHHFPIGSHSVKGKTEKVDVYVVSSASNVRKNTAGIEIGYAKERRILDLAVESYVRCTYGLTSTAPRVLAVGPSGVGKSNLLGYVKQKLSKAQMEYTLAQGSEIKQFTPYFALHSLLDYILHNSLGDELDIGSANSLDSGLHVGRVGAGRRGLWRKRAGNIVGASDGDYNPPSSLSSRIISRQSSEHGEHCLSPLERFLKDIGEDPAVAPLLVDLLPTLTVPENEYTKSMDGATRRAVVKRLVVDIVKRSVARNRFVIIFDDAQWIDPISLDIIQAILKNCLEAMVILFTRPLGEKPLPIYAQIFASPGIQKLEINGLEESDMAEFLQWKFDIFGVKNVSESVASAVYQISKGLPLVLDSLLESARPLFFDLFIVDEAGNLIFRDDECREVLEGMSGFDSSVMMQFDKLKPDFQTFLLRVSILGQYFDLDDLAYTAGRDVPSSDLIQFIDFHDTHQFLLSQNPEDPECTQYYFRHIKYMETIYESISYQNRLEWHELAAKHFEGMLTEEGNMDELIAIVVYHYRKTNISAKQVEYLARLGLHHYDRAHVRESANALEALIEVLMGPGSDITVAPEKKALWMACLGSAKVMLLSFGATEKDLIIDALHLVGQSWPKDAREGKKAIIWEAAEFYKRWRRTKGGMLPFRPSPRSLIFKKMDSPRAMNDQEHMEIVRIRILCYQTLFRMSIFSTLLPKDLTPLILLRQCNTAVTVAHVDKPTWCFVLYYLSYGISFSLASLSKIFFYKALETEKGVPENDRGLICKGYQVKTLMLITNANIEEAKSSCIFYIKHSEQRADIENTSIGFTVLDMAQFISCDIKSFDAQLVERSREPSMYRLGLLSLLIGRRIFSGDLKQAQGFHDTLTGILKVMASTGTLHRIIAATLEAWFAFEREDMKEFLERFEEAAVLVSKSKQVYPVTILALLWIATLTTKVAALHSTDVSYGERLWTGTDSARMINIFQKILDGLRLFSLKFRLHLFYWQMVHTQSTRLILQGNTVKATKLLQKEMKNKKRRELLEKLPYYKGLVFSTLGLFVANDADRRHYYDEASRLFEDSGFKHLSDWLDESRKTISKII
ncbi:Glycosylphosphatidylinositol specific phospholipase D1 [Chytridiales sp. JEL 0842]|nr:Glycosylphosphatidylinositol specific phospholipase D1 [Chytridiales sp. JEL 0842]